MSSIPAPAHATGVYDLPSVNVGEPIWLIDGADVISRSTESQLNAALGRLAAKTGNEVRMIVIRRLDYGATIDSFMEELFNTWYPTPAEQSNQTLIVIDTLTNRSAIRTGEGVRELLTPEITDSIASETIALPLKDLQYNQALVNAGDRLEALLSGEEDPGPPAIKAVNIEGTYAKAEETDDRTATVWVVVLLALATIIPMVTYFWYVGFPGS